MTSVQLAAPPAVLWIARTLEDAGYETWAVGGAIRDALASRDSNSNPNPGSGSDSGDWDLATRATPARVRKIFRRTIPIGIEHGTVGVLARDGVMYEVTTFRKDVETDGRHAVVEFADDIDSDLARRDFTVNAIAWHPTRKVFHDPFGGADDLEQRVLRTVGEPRDRFREDYLRILRAVRFAGRLGLEVEDATWVAMSEFVDQLTVLSPERVRDELLKVLATDRNAGVALDLYRTSGALRVLYPELQHAIDEDGGQEAWALRLRSTERLPLGRPHLRLAGLLRGLEPAQAAALLLRLRLSNVATNEIAHLAGADPLPDPDAEPVAVRRWLHGHGAEYVTSVARLDLAEARVGAAGVTPERVVAAWRRMRAVRRNHPAVNRGDLEIDGRGLKRLGLRPGPAFGRILDALLEEILEDPTLNVRESLEARALALAAEMERDG
jgi:tRNA nucleotidyltransferase (CCA-adding enzyme)